MAAHMSPVQCQLSHVLAPHARHYNGEAQQNTPQSAARAREESKNEAMADGRVTRERCKNDQIYVRLNKAK